MTMTVVSLFAGIDGLGLGLERAGMRVVGQVEIDPFCIEVLRKHWPEVWRWTDIRTLTREVMPPEVAAVDLICGGFP